ncbi:MAG: hypothetical protein DCC75_00770 [Proteobacteria bacterium]|nr:MAG: hypothetical protein DCC75_00770 [Pseudomonadota bacterium]
MVAGEEDKIARDTDAKKIYIGATSVQKDDKDLLLLRSDYHGEPPLVANHFAPAARDAALLESEDKGLVSANPSRPRIAERLRKAGRQGKAREAADEVDLIRADEAGKPDALDFYGFWKLFDGLYQAAFFGRHREFALGGTSQQKSMGIWSDGVPVKEIEVM